MSKRVRVLGDLYHGRIPEGAIYVGRAAPGLKASPFANPFTLKKHGPAALTLFAKYLDSHPDLVERARRELAGHDLACWCHLGQPCHADLLLEILSRRGDEKTVAFCDPEDCDGHRHTCWNCGGDGYAEGDPGEDSPCDLEPPEEICNACHGEGGWPCPLARRESGS